MRRRFPLSLLLLAALGACASHPTAACPPSPTVAAATADTVPHWRKALDSEALFTVVSGLKPVSCGFWSTRIDAAHPDFAQIAAVRAALRPWQDDELWADVLVFHDAYDGKRAAEAYVVDRAALAQLLADEAAFFAPHGIAPDTHPAEVFAVVERLPDDDRHRGMGLLFGYPRHAIEFFVAAQHRTTEDGKPAPRRFVQIPTFGAATGRFVYAVPQDHVDDDADRALSARAATILARYRELRPQDSAVDPVVWRGVVQRLRAEFPTRGRQRAAASGRIAAASRPAARLEPVGPAAGQLPTYSSASRSSISAAWNGRMRSARRPINSAMTTMRGGVPAGDPGAGGSRMSPGWIG